VEGDCVPEVALPGVHRLPVQEPQAGGRPEAGTEALLGTLLPYFPAVQYTQHVEVICGRIKLLKIQVCFIFWNIFKELNLTKLTLSLAARCHSWAASAAVAGSHVPYGKVPSHSVTDHQGVLAGNSM
jgi:hypothetical protein